MKADRASATARLIAAATVMREHCRGHGGEPPAGAAAWCERFLSTSRADRLLRWSARAKIGQALWRLTESVALPGVVSHWMRRKREIDRMARASAAEGFRQLVVLGAGLDTLAFRLNQERLYPRILSGDHPATLAVIRRSAWSLEPPGVLASLDSTAVDSAPQGVELFPLDFTTGDLCAALSASQSFDCTLATLFVIEGVLMYLPEPAVAGILRSLPLLPVPRARLIASSMIVEPGESIGFRGQSNLVTRWLSRHSEPMLWASTRAALPAFLLELGWSEARLIDLTSNEAAHRAASSGLESEQLVVADHRRSN